MDQVTEVNKAVTGLPTTVRNSYTYENDRIKMLTHSNTADASTTYTFNYGVFGLPTSIKAGEHTLVTNTYDTTNRTFNLLKALYGNGAYVEYTYDEYDRVVGMKYNGDTADRYTFHYDNCGALGRVRDNANNLETCYLYDFAGRLVEVNTKGLNGNTYTNKFTWNYDDLGQVTSFKFWVNGNACYSNYAYDKDNRLTQFSIGSIKKTWGYDSYGRISSVQCLENNTANVTTTPTYTDPDTSHTSAQIKTWRNQALDYDVTYTYTYDDRGNILTISDGTNTTSYTYDGLNQLTRENNQAANKTWVYSYDAGGNILSKTEYAYTTGEVGTVLDAISYEYNDAKGWKDILTSYNGVTRTHDEIGNLISDGTWTYTWEGGRRLKSMTKADGTTVTFAYDNNGLRQSKTVDGSVTKYAYHGSYLAHIVSDTDRLAVRRTPEGKPISLQVNGWEYFYIQNQQGDVTGLADSAGKVVVEYTYDAWGNMLSVTGEKAETLGKKNPLRYRGYVYDEESGLYYLNSRYYDPKVGRFICADGYASTGQGLLGANTFVYCGNEPVDRLDPSGCFYDAAWEYHEEMSQYLRTQVEYGTTPQEGIISRTHFQKNSSSHGKLPLYGEPNSVKRRYGSNGELVQERVYGSDGRAEKDVDHTNHGNPKEHPKVPHEHGWIWKGGNPQRTPETKECNWWDPIVGMGIVFLAGAGMIYLVGNDLTGIGAVDDWALIPVSGFMTYGLSLLGG